MIVSARLLLTSLLLTGTTQAQVLLMPDTTSDTLVSFDPVDGSVLNPNLFALPNETLISAIDVNGEIWVSSQSGDAVYRYDFVGNPLGQIGPTFSGGAFDNIRGINYINGIVYVTNFGTVGGALGSAVIALDATGSYLFDFSTAGLANSPFSVMPFQGDLLVAGGANNSDVYRFTSTGTPVGVFHDSGTINFGHQCAPALDGNVWCAGFTSDNIVKLDATNGQVLATLQANSTRGVFELYNGNLLWTEGTGVFVYDPLLGTSTLVHSGGGRHLNLYGGAGSMPASKSFYGSGCAGLQADANGRPTLGNVTFELLARNVPTVSPVALFAFGSVQVEPGMNLTTIGMAGCFGYSNLDLGLFVGSGVVAGQSTVLLPVANTATLAGAQFAVQSVAFSSTTALGLAAGNGLLLTLGN